MQRIFAWRVQERLGYQAIANRLNTDLASNPPRTPVRPDAAVGHWTSSNVCDVLTNPKHTGHMVWNRHARKKGHNRANPVENWVWSQQPVHEPLVDMQTFITAQEVSGHRFGSRSTSTRNIRHPQTKHTYLLRTFLFCGVAGYSPKPWPNYPTPHATNRPSGSPPRNERSSTSGPRAVG